MATCTSRPAWTADALNALVFNGYVRPNVEEPDRRRVTWRDAVHLRSVSVACRAAVDNEEFWRLQYGLLRMGKVFSPPAIREVLEHGTASQRPYTSLSAVCDGHAFFVIDAGNAASFSFLRLFREYRKPPCNWGQVAVAVGGTQLLLGTQQVPAGRLAGYRWRGRPIDLVVI